MIKKQWAICLVLMMLAVICFGVNALETAGELENIWYMLDEEGTVLTVFLPANETTGYGWVYEISNPETLELIKETYIPDENPQKLAGVGGTWLADFRGTQKCAGEGELTLRYKRSWEDEALETRVIKVMIGENNKLKVVSADIILPVEADAGLTPEAK